MKRTLLLVLAFALCVGLMARQRAEAWIQQPCNYFPLSIACGGTGATTVAGAQANLGISTATPAPTPYPTPTPEGYLGFQSNQVASGANLDTGQSWQSFKLTKAVTFDNCIAAWDAKWSCSTYPTMAVYDITASAVICSQQVSNSGQPGTSVSLTTSTASAGDILAIINDGAGSGCSASNGQMVAFGLAFH